MSCEWVTLERGEAKLQVHDILKFEYAIFTVRTTARSDRRNSRTLALYAGRRSKRVSYARILLEGKQPDWVGSNANLRRGTTVEANDRGRRYKTDKAMNLAEENTKDIEGIKKMTH